jgi:hypothetical protein
MALVVISAAPSSHARAAETRVPVTFSGGHETDPRDGGRPVVRVAAALGVKPEVFREAFRGVTPARDGRPSPQARRNKAALMKVLAPHGVTNERLDEVSDYYRYRPQRCELWKSTPARAYAVVADGKARSVVVTDPGSGYSSPPAATVRGQPRCDSRSLSRSARISGRTGRSARSRSCRRHPPGELG